MPNIRTALPPETHDQLKIIAIGLGTTLSHVIVLACEAYVEVLGIDWAKAKKATYVEPLAHSPKRNGKRS